MCRAPTVLSADRCELFEYSTTDYCHLFTILLCSPANVDWALLNFMKDWFPVEARKKLQQNEHEAAEEEMRELGLDVRSCVLM